MKRTPLKRKKALGAQRGPAKTKLPGVYSTIRPSTKRMRQGKSTGKPTAEQFARFLAIKAIGCLACLKDGHRPWPAEVHHLTVGGRHGQRRRGHDASIGLCSWHHRGVPPVVMTVAQATHERGPSYHHHARGFRAAYGQDDSLLELQDQLVALQLGVTPIQGDGDE